MNPPDSKDDPGAAAPPAGPRFWWVNHQHTHRQELDGEYLWSPKRSQHGARGVSCDNMIRVMPGDVVFSYADSAIRAVGVVLGRAREAPKPQEFGGPASRAADSGVANAGPANREPARQAARARVLGSRGPGNRAAPEAGWQVAVRFHELATPLWPKDHAAQLDSGPGRRSPRNDDGVYLSAIPQSMADALRQLLGAELERIVEAITLTCGGRLAEDAAEEAIQQRSDIDPIVKKTLVSARLGQGVYRAQVERIEQQCRVTGLLDRRHLRASHIKPWCVCDDREKLDGFNGLLLSPHIEHLFYRGYISFADSGELLLSAELNPAVLESWGIALPCSVGTFLPEQCWYLAYHRDHVFGKPDGGRRRQGPEALPQPQPQALSGGVSDS